MVHYGYGDLNCFPLFYSNKAPYFYNATWLCIVFLACIAPSTRLCIFKKKYKITLACLWNFKWGLVCQSILVGHWYSSFSGDNPSNLPMVHSFTTNCVTHFLPPSFMTYNNIHHIVLGLWKSSRLDNDYQTQPLIQIYYLLEVPSW